MVMDTLQIRMNKELVKRLDIMVKSGIYANRADVIRDAVRRFFWENQVGMVKPKGNSVELVRNARKMLSKEKFNLKELNNFGSKS